MIVKFFVFLFVNSYASFYYLAFLAENLGDCPVHGCMYALAINLAVIFGSCLASAACVQLLLPYAQYQYSYYLAGGSAKSGASSDGASSGSVSTGGKEAWLSRPEREHLLATVRECFPAPASTFLCAFTITEYNALCMHCSDLKCCALTYLTHFAFVSVIFAQYDQLSATTDDYAELAVGFGYTALFVAALPIAALCYLLFSTLQIKGDGWKLLHLYKRPFPRGCEDIGTWYVLACDALCAKYNTSCMCAVFWTKCLFCVSVIGSLGPLGGHLSSPVETCFHLYYRNHRQSVFLMITVASVVTNAGLAVFTMQDLDAYATNTRYWCFIGFQWVCFSLQVSLLLYVVQYCIVCCCISYTDEARK